MIWKPSTHQMMALLRTEVAEGVPRHCKVNRGFLELPTMTANGRVRRGRSLSFDASPPNVPLSSIWVDGDLEGLEGSDGTERSSGRTIYVDFRLGNIHEVLSV